MSGSTNNGSLLTAVVTSTPPTTWSNTSMLAQSGHSSKTSDHALDTIVSSIDGDPEGLNTREVDFRSTIKAVAISLAAVVWLLLVSDFVNNFVMIIVVVVLLWTVCGGHASLCPINLAPPAPNISPHVDKKIEPWLDDLIGPPLIEVLEVVDFLIEVIEVVDFPIEMVKAADFHELKEADHILHDPEALAAVPNETEDDQGTLAWMNRISDAVHHICECELVPAHSAVESVVLAVTEDTEDDQDTLAWMDQIFDTVNHVCEYEPTTTRSIEGPAMLEDVEEIHSQNEEPMKVVDCSNEIRFQDDFSQGPIVLHVPFNMTPEEYVQITTYLMMQHEYPTFNEGSLVAVVNEKCFRNYYPAKGEVIYTANACVPSHCLWEECTMGRSVAGDTKDMDFMMNALKDQLPAELIEVYEQLPLDLRYGGRDRTTNVNQWYVSLNWQWYLARGPPGMITNWDSIREAEISRVKNFTPACPDNERYLHGPSSSLRAYLTEAEELVVNCGIIGYSKFYNEFPELSRLQKDLDARPDHTLPPKQHSVLNWLNGMQEDQLLNPSGFDPCKCGVKAVVDIRLYREEVERSLHPTSVFNSQFPLSYISQGDFDEQHDSRRLGEEAADDARIPRCQKILQACQDHEMVSNNIFVLIDTSVDDINERISSPEGLLPAPGQMKLTNFRDGYQTQQHFLMIPYEKLPERCVHGHPHPSLGPSCQTCFRKYQAAKVKNKATLEHSRNAHVSYRGPPGFPAAPRGFANPSPGLEHFSPGRVPAPPGFQEAHVFSRGPPGFLVAPQYRVGRPGFQAPPSRFRRCAS